MAFLTRFLYTVLGACAGFLIAFYTLEPRFEEREDFIVEVTAFIHCYYFYTISTNEPAEIGEAMCEDYAHSFANNFKDIKSQGE